MCVVEMFEMSKHSITSGRRGSCSTAGGFNDCNQGTLGNLVAKLDLERLHLPRHLGTDIDLLDAFEQTGGQHRVFNVRPLDAGAQVLRRLGRCLYGVENQPGHRRQSQAHTDFAKLRLFHK